MDLHAVSLLKLPHNQRGVVDANPFSIDVPLFESDQLDQTEDPLAANINPAGKHRSVLLCEAVNDDIYACAELPLYRGAVILYDGNILN